jgi:hypothetical protein
MCKAIYIDKLTLKNLLDIYHSSSILLLFSLLLIIGFQLLIAQGSEITGTVTESETNLPLIGVNIMIK